MRIHHRSHAAGNNIPLTGRAMTLFATNRFKPLRQPLSASSASSACSSPASPRLAPHPISVFARMYLGAPAARTLPPPEDALPSAPPAHSVTPPEDKTLSWVVGSAVQCCSRSARPHWTSPLREYKTKNQELEARLRAAEDRDRPAASPPPPAPLPIFNVVVDKESIPPFRGDTPAAQPLRRNQEVEAWIRHIENVAKPATDATFISAARASCKGPADLIVNSPMFDGIREWAIFKTLLRRKFRGTCSSTDFFTILNECRMTTTQGPQDFFQQLEGIVYQGVRDYPDVVGNPEPLLKRLFLQGLPLWLREYLAIIDELPLDRLVETAQRIWNTRTGVARTEPLADRHPPRPLRAVAPVEEPPEHRRTRWCSYHRTSRHDNTECRYRPRRLACFRANRRDTW
ncbi:hypothetical protein C7M84_007356 [Penaeus vannamei]|uniref:Retrotransposon gag domain-containing protein n=1 Tax=Penaeus vannamei TaxID=6689 RepID=A0A423UAQ7_PENVA|nr:hypothetical protein C7M84_007356 [Penaeus vannamei]